MDGRQPRLMGMLSAPVRRRAAAICLHCYVLRQTDRPAGQASYSVLWYTHQSMHNSARSRAVVAHSYTRSPLLLAVLFYISMPPPPPPPYEKHERFGRLYSTGRARHPHSVPIGLMPKAHAPREQFSCLLYTSPSPRDRQKSRMPSSA